MEAIVFPAAFESRFSHVDDPVCGPDEVMISIEASGICGTDLHIYRNEYLSGFPLIPGHEFGGIVEAVGSAVQTGIRAGDRVAVDPNLYCGYCDFCRKEQSNHCANWQGIGITRAGGFAQRAAVPARACYAVPSSFTARQLAFIEPLACVCYGMSRLPVRPADRILLFGGGPIGLLLVQALRHAGASQITVVDKQPDRLRLAEQLGATSVRPAGSGLDTALRQLAPGGFDIVVDATGVPAVIERGFAYLRPRGRYLMFGVAPKDASIRVTPFDIFKNDWQIIGSFALCYTFQQAIAWLETGVIDVEPLVSHTAPLRDFPSLFDAFSRGETMKVHLLPNA
ncbi:MAG: zinc-dependent alcohol dehydrogenase family protein [Rhodothermales bacterium]